MLVVAMVLGQVQAHLADDVPRGMARAQPLGDSATVSANLFREGVSHLGPAGGDPVGVDVLRARHGRYSAGQSGALVQRAVHFNALAPLLQIGHGT